MGPTVYKGIKGRIYSADFGDMSNDPELGYFCTTPKSCLKRGVHDLTRCTGMCRNNTIQSQTPGMCRNNMIQCQTPGMCRINTIQ